MIQVLKDIGSIISPLLAAIALCSMIIKPIRNKIMNTITKVSRADETDKIITEIDTLKSTFEDYFDGIKVDVKDLKEESRINMDANKCVLGHSIIDAYEKWHKEDFIPEEDKDYLLEYYRIYKKLGGNGKVEYRYDELINKRTQ